MVGGGIDSIAFCWVGGSGLVYSHAIIIVYDWTKNTLFIKSVSLTNSWNEIDN